MPDPPCLGAIDRMLRSKQAIGTLLMDQSVISGIGNVYRAEALFVHGIHPQLPGRALTREQWDALWADLVDAAARRRAARQDRDAAPRARPAAGRTRPSARCARAVYVYRRTGEPCLVCGTPVAHAQHLARNLFWCPGCQAPESGVGACAGRRGQRGSR